MNIFVNQGQIGWSLLLSAILSIIGFIFLALMFLVKIKPYGRLNDVTYVLSLFPLFLYLLGIYGSISMDYPFLGFINVIIGISGILLVTVSQTRLILRKVKLEKNMPEVALGSGILGASILLNNLVSQRTKLFPDNHNWAGIVTGLMMTMGIPTALFFGKELLNLMSGKLIWAKANKTAILVIILGFIGQIGFLVWSIGLGRYLVIFH